MEKLTYEEKQVWIGKYYRYIDSYIKMNLADKNSYPHLEIAMDEESYTNNDIIHIGIANLNTVSEDELTSFVLYITGHEIQHIRSTTKRAWEHGITRGVQVVLEEYAAKTEPGKWLFRKDKDYEIYLEQLAKDGLKISMRTLTEFSHFIANSLEDGRIERIRCITRPGFKDYMVTFRGKTWNEGPVDESWADSLDEPYTYLSIVLNQVLTLATVSLYQKGFTKICAKDSKPQVLINKLMPDIAAGVGSSTCRECMEASIRICRHLAVEIMEASRKTPLEELLEHLMQQFSQNESYTADSSTEETNGQNGSSPFGQSDLVLEVDDETFDKLSQSEASGGSGQGGMRIVIKRKSQSGSQDDKDGENSSNGKFQKTEPSGDGENADRQGNAGKSPCGTSKGGSLNDDAETSDNKSSSSGGGNEASDMHNADSDSTGKDGNNPSDNTQAQSEESGGDSGRQEDELATSGSGPQDDNEASGEQESKVFASTSDNSGSKEDTQSSETNSEKASPDSSNTGDKQDATDSLPENQRADDEAAGDTGNADDGKDSVRSFDKKDPDEFVKNAINEARNSTEEELNDAARMANIENRYGADTEIENEGVDTLPSLDSVNEKYPYEVEFNEMVRDYKTDSKMPFELLGRANVLKRKVKRIFQNMQKPVLRGRKTGMLDPAHAYKLAMNEFECFKKKAKISEFDGCAYLLADNSGSMEGEKQANCCQALAVIEHAFCHIMPLKIAAFDALGMYSVRHVVIKNWHEIIHSNGSFNFLANNCTGFGNKDGYSIRVATKELLSQPEKKKLLIILSDGLPSAYPGHDGAKDVHDAVMDARKKGIMVISIFFGDASNATAFGSMYEKNYIVTRPEAIGDDLVRILKRFCFR